MQFINECVRQYSQTAQDFMRNRKQQWDRRSQYFAVTHNPTTGHKIPCCVKFPKIADTFEKCDRSHPWAAHREGKFNGLYVIPDESVAVGVELEDVIRGDVNITQDFLQSPVFALLKVGFNIMYKKLSPHGGKVRLVHSEYNFSTDDPTIDNLSK